jgi:transposase
MRYQHQPKEIPEETVKVAKRVFPQGNAYLKLRDELGGIYSDSDFGELFSHAGRPAESPGNLALVVVMQYMEGLTDRQAAEAVRARIDWKYALGLKIDDPGFSYSVLSKFRQRLLEGGAEARFLERILARAEERDLLQKEEQRTDATHVLSAVKDLNRLELVGETLRAALEGLAKTEPTWLQQRITADWIERYGERLTEYRLPQKEPERLTLAEAIGGDGLYLLQELAAADSPPDLRQLAEMLTLGQVWEQQYEWEGAAVRWRGDDELPPAGERLTSPFDVEVRAARKRQTQWRGYKVHLTESCHPQFPFLITHVHTTMSPEVDSHALTAIQQQLTDHGRLPTHQLADSGYVTADQLVASRRRGIDLLGPVQPDSSWQGKQPDAFDLSHFDIDWSRQVVTCPMEQRSTTWRQGRDRYGKQTISVRFSQVNCASCSARPRCTRAKTSGRKLSLRPRAQHEALAQARQRQQTEEFWERYRRRSGVEAAISQATRCFHLRRTRFRGLTKTHLHHVIIAAALNVTRLVAWLQEPAHASRRRSRLQKLPLAA